MHSITFGNCSIVHSIVHSTTHNTTHNTMKRNRKHFQTNRVLFNPATAILHLNIHRTRDSLLDEYKGRRGQECVRDVVGNHGFARLRAVCVSNHQTNGTGIGRLLSATSQVFYSKAKGMDGIVGRKINDTTVR